MSHFTPVTKTIRRSIGVARPTANGRKWILEIEPTGWIRIRPYRYADETFASINVSQLYLAAQQYNGPTKREQRHRNQEDQD